MLTVQQGVDLLVNTVRICAKYRSKRHGYSSAVVVRGRSDEPTNNFDRRATALWPEPFE